jgi:hypothetical protein
MVPLNPCVHPFFLHGLVFSVHVLNSYGFQMAAPPSHWIAED